MNTLPTVASLVTAATNVKAMLIARDMSDAGRLLDASAVFDRVVEALQYVYAKAPTKTASGADKAALWTAASIADGDVWKAASAADTEDDALETAKGSAVVAGDFFQRVGSNVVFLGTASAINTVALPTFRE